MKSITAAQVLIVYRAVDINDLKLLKWIERLFKLMYHVYSDVVLFPCVMTVFRDKC